MYLPLYEVADTSLSLKAEFGQIFKCVSLGMIEKLLICDLFRHINAKYLLVLFNYNDL